METILIKNNDHEYYGDVELGTNLQNLFLWNYRGLWKNEFDFITNVFARCLCAKEYDLQKKKTNLIFELYGGCDKMDFLFHLLSMMYHNSSI